MASLRAAASLLAAACGRRSTRGAVAIATCMGASMAATGSDAKPSTSATEVFEGLGRQGVGETLELLQGADPAVGWTAYLLVSPTRSSLAGIAPQEHVSRVLDLHNGELGPAEPGPETTAHLRPWRLAEAAECKGRESARAVSMQVRKASGFRARVLALRKARLEEPALADATSLTKKVEVAELLGDLDGLTYVPVEFMHPADPSRKRTFLALVDTGSGTCDLRQSFIDDLGLPIDKAYGSASMQTAAGLTVERHVYRAVVRVLGSEGCVHVTPAEEEEEEQEQEKKSPAEGTELTASTGSSGSPELDDVDKAFGFDSISDDALIGSEALAALNLLVDCRNRRLVPAPPARWPRMSAFRSGSLHVPVEFHNPVDRSLRVTANALVDTGCTDMDLNQRLIDELHLAIDPSEGSAQFETAGGVTIEAPIYLALVRALGREAVVRLSPSEAQGESDSEEEDEEEEEEEEAAVKTPGASGGSNSDEALLGHDALAALGLLVDCRQKRLVAAPL